MVQKSQEELDQLLGLTFSRVHHALHSFKDPTKNGCVPRSYNVGKELTSSRLYPNVQQEVVQV